MVLCSTSQEKKIELVKVPENAKIGERVVFEGYEGEFEKQLNSKKLPKILKDLGTDDQGIVCFNKAKAKVSSGYCFSNFGNASVA
jgi:metal-dependent hydrolase (beta-lactamase superfamily II)